MKKILLLVTACMLLSLQGFAQFGVKAGLNFNSLGQDDAFNTSYSSVLEKKTGFHAGVLYRFKVPVIGLAVQPELIYSQVKGEMDLMATMPSSSIGGSSPLATGEVSINYIQLPVALQMGLDLVLLRPYIQVVPYVGCTIADNVSTKSNHGLDFTNKLKLDTERFNYGIGVGAGLDIWRLQVSGRYNWDLGNVADFKWEGIGTLKGGKSKGFQLSVALFF